MYQVNHDPLEKFKADYTLVQRKAITKAVLRMIQDALNVASYDYADGMILEGDSILNEVSYLSSGLEELWR